MTTAALLLLLLLVAVGGVVAWADRVFKLELGE
jgi:hypothetical protein